MAGFCWYMITFLRKLQSIYGGLLSHGGYPNRWLENPKKWMRNHTPHSKVGSLAVNPQSRHLFGNLRAVSKAQERVKPFVGKTLIDQIVMSELCNGITQQRHHLDTMTWHLVTPMLGDPHGPSFYIILPGDVGWFGIIQASRLPLPVSSFQFLPVPSSSFQFLPVPSSSFQFLPVPSSSFQFLPVPSSSFQFLPVPSSSVGFYCPFCWPSCASGADLRWLPWLPSGRGLSRPIAGSLRSEQGDDSMRWKSFTCHNGHIT